MSAIQIANVGIADYEQMMKRTIREVLGEHKDYLMSFEIAPKIASCIDEANDMAKTKGIMTVRGFLSLDGEKGRMLEFDMEMGLTRSEDIDIAEQCAFQCLAVVEKMLQERHEN